MSNQENAPAPQPLTAGVAGKPLEPVLLVDSREKKPLVFKHLMARSCTLHTGDYSITGLESRFTIERKSMPDLVATLCQRRKLFMDELERMRSHEFRRLLIIGDWKELLECLSRRRITLDTVMGNLAAIDARGVPVVWRESPDKAAAQIESWAWYYYAGLSKALTGKHISAPNWARLTQQNIHFSTPQTSTPQTHEYTK